MKTLATIIVDDEPLAREILEGFVAECSELKLTACFDNAIDARAFLKNNHADLLLLDINLPQISGIELMKSLSNPPLVIFTTAYPQFAIDGFEVDAIDYLLKPIPFERFKKAISKVAEKQAAILEVSPNFIMLKSNKKTYKINLDSILFLESVGDYVKVNTTVQNLVVHDTIKNLSEQLPSKFFMRIHKSFTIAIDKIQYIEGNQIKIGDAVLPVSLSYKEALLARLNQ